MKIFLSKLTPNPLCELVDGRIIHNNGQTYYFQFETEEEMRREEPFLAKSALTLGFEVYAVPSSLRWIHEIDSRLVETSQIYLAVTAYGELAFRLEGWVREQLRRKK